MSNHTIYSSRIKYLTRYIEMGGIYEKKASC
jgi:hypothetical protein